MVQLKLVSHCFDLYDFMICFMWSNLKSIWNYLFTLWMRLNASCKVRCLHNSLKSSEISKDWGQKFPNTYLLLVVDMFDIVLTLVKWYLIDISERCCQNANLKSFNLSRTINKLSILSLGLCFLILFQT